MLQDVLGGAIPIKELGSLSGRVFKQQLQKGPACRTASMSRASASPWAARVSARRVATAMLVSEADLHDHAGLMISCHSAPLCSKRPGLTRYSVSPLQCARRTSSEGSKFCAEIASTSTGVWWASTADLSSAVSDLTAFCEDNRQEPGLPDVVWGEGVRYPLAHELPVGVVGLRGDQTGTGRICSSLHDEAHWSLSCVSE